MNNLIDPPDRYSGDVGKFEILPTGELVLNNEMAKMELFGNGGDHLKKEPTLFELNRRKDEDDVSSDSDDPSPPRPPTPPLFEDLDISSLVNYDSISPPSEPSYSPDRQYDPRPTSPGEFVSSGRIKFKTPASSVKPRQIGSLPTFSICSFTSSGPITPLDVYTERKTSEFSVSSSEVTLPSSVGSLLEKDEGGPRRRRTKKQMDAMNDDERIEVHREQNNECSKVYRKKKKDGEAALKKKVADLEIEKKKILKDLEPLETEFSGKFGEKSLKKLRNRVAHEVGTVDKQQEREELKETVQEIQAKLAQFEKEKTALDEQSPDKGTVEWKKWKTAKNSNGSRRCRANQELGVAELNLEAFNLEQLIEQQKSIRWKLQKALGYEVLDDSGFDDLEEPPPPPDLSPHPGQHGRKPYFLQCADSIIPHQCHAKSQQNPTVTTFSPSVRRPTTSPPCPDDYGSIEKTNTQDPGHYGTQEMPQQGMGFENGPAHPKYSTPREQAMTWTPIPRDANSMQPDPSMLIFSPIPYTPPPHTTTSTTICVDYLYSNPRDDANFTNSTAIDTSVSKQNRQEDTAHFDDSNDYIIEDLDAATILIGERVLQDAIPNGEMIDPMEGDIDDNFDIGEFLLLGEFVAKPPSTGGGVRELREHTQLDDRTLSPTANPIDASGKERIEMFRADDGTQAALLNYEENAVQNLPMNALPAHGIPPAVKNHASHHHMHPVGQAALVPPIVANGRSYYDSSWNMKASAQKTSRALLLASKSQSAHGPKGVGEEEENKLSQTFHDQYEIGDRGPGHDKLLPTSQPSLQPRCWAVGDLQHPLVHADPLATSFPAACPPAAGPIPTPFAAFGSGPGGPMATSFAAPGYQAAGPIATSFTPGTQAPGPISTSFAASEFGPICPIATSFTTADFLARGPIATSFTPGYPSCDTQGVDSDNNAPLKPAAQAPETTSAFTGSTTTRFSAISMTTSATVSPKLLKSGPHQCELDAHYGTPAASLDRAKKTIAAARWDCKLEMDSLAGGAAPNSGMKMAEDVYNDVATSRPSADSNQKVTLPRGRKRKSDEKDRPCKRAARGGATMAEAIASAKD